MNEWERQANEPELWWQRFEAFRKMGPGRSLLRLYNRERTAKGQPPATSTPGAWDKAVKAYNWRKRAARYDIARLESYNWYERSRVVENQQSTIAGLRKKEQL